MIIENKKGQKKVMLLKIFIGYYVIVAILFIIEHLDISIEATRYLKKNKVKLKKDKTVVFSKIIAVIKLLIYSILPIFRIVVLFVYWTRRDDIIENTIDEVIETRGVED